MSIDVVAVSTPLENAWRRCIVDYAGEVVEEPRETLTTIAAALASGAVRLPAIDVANRRRDVEALDSTFRLNRP